MLRAAVVTALSGPLAEYGRAGALALDVWTHWHHRQFGERVELSVVDAHPDPVGAVRQAEREHPDLLFGPYGSSPTAAVVTTTTRLVWNHGGARVPLCDNLVSVLAPADSYFVGAIDAVHHRDPALRTVALLCGDTGFGRAIGEGTALRATQLGLTVRRALPGSEPSDAEMLLVAGNFADELAVAQRALPGRWRAAGFVAAGVEDLLQQLGPRRNGLLAPAQWLPETAPLPDHGPSAAGFVSGYRARAGHDPPYPAAQAFAAGVIAGRCLQDTGTTDDAALRNAARALDCVTMFGRFRLDSETGRQIGHRILTVQWQDGRRRVVWPPEKAQSPLHYPLT